jgi:predicted transcriptional regulator
MSTATLTTEIDTGLKRELDEIARLDGRTSAEVARLAISNYVEERRATRELVQVGLRLVQSGGPFHSSESIHEWFSADEGAPFPKAD